MTPWNNDHQPHPPQPEGSCPSTSVRQGAKVRCRTSPGGHPLGMEGRLPLGEEARRQALRRLASAGGHLNHVRRLLDQPGVSCHDVLFQLRAVVGALRGAGDVLVLAHAQECLRVHPDPAAQIMTTLKHRRHTHRRRLS